MTHSVAAASRDAHRPAGACDLPLRPISNQSALVLHDRSTQKPAAGHSDVERLFRVDSSNSTLVKAVVEIA